jgi:hypothetical protein
MHGWRRRELLSGARMGVRHRMTNFGTAIDVYPYGLLTAAGYELSFVG